MSTTIDESFVRAYEREVHDVFQRMGSFIRPTVRTKTSVVGKSTTFQKIGKGTATTKARHGNITPMNQTHTAIECTLEDFYAGDWADKLDEAKVNIDERDAIARGGAWALGRKVDDQIVTKMNASSTTGSTWGTDKTTKIRNALVLASKKLDANDVPNDGQRYGLLTPTGWSLASVVEEFSSADYVGPAGLPLTAGAPMMGMFKRFQNILYQVHSGLPGEGTATAKQFVYHKSAVGYASGAHAMNAAENNAVAADITWHGDRAAHFVNHMMSGGACVIDSTGVVEDTLDDTATLPT